LDFDEFFAYAAKQKMSARMAQAKKEDAEKADAELEQQQQEEEQEHKEVEKPPVHWLEFAEKLPVGRTKELTAKRQELFAYLDHTDDGKLSHSEVAIGIQQLLHPDGELEAGVDIESIVREGFIAVANADGKGGEHGDTVESREFRLLLFYLQQYFRIQALFLAIDENSSGKLSKAEFKRALPQFEKLGIAIHDADAAFLEMDANNGGVVTLQEFIGWATAKNLKDARAQDN
jgi:hypothetical protein